jgi:benzoyl-CoA reductase/2-hydroxyglutaryl-CoA dehydratase subunit BcrC/BadD/HgdB
MQALERLEMHLRGRSAEVGLKKKEGAKVVGFIPGFTPEELIYASGAIPVGLIRGGDSAGVQGSMPYITRFVDTFCRAQVGYQLSKEEPLYKLPDLLIVPCVDDNFRALADVWRQTSGVEVFRLGVPHEKTDHGVSFYVEILGLLKKRLEELTGKEIKDVELREAIELYNSLRKSLNEISLTRTSASPPISGKDFTRLNHASYCGDLPTVIQIAESLRSELEVKRGQEEKPRILLVASTLALGDYKVFDLLEEAGATVVFEEACEGMRQYWEPVSPNGNLLAALGNKYLRRRMPPPPFFHPPEGRFEFITSKAKEFKVDGIVWYELLYRESYETEFFLFSRRLERETGIPLLLLQSEYDTSEISIFRTRIEAFIESIRASQK